MERPVVVLVQSLSFLTEAIFFSCLFHLVCWLIEIVCPEPKVRVRRQSLLHTYTLCHLPNDTQVASLSLVVLMSLYQQSTDEWLVRQKNKNPKWNPNRKRKSRRLIAALIAPTNQPYGENTLTPRMCFGRFCFFFSSGYFSISYFTWSFEVDHIIRTIFSLRLPP